jgi:hypothetical protein
MKCQGRIILCLFTLVAAVGCATTEVSNQQTLVHEQLPRPGHIWVYDFAATPADVPADSALAGQHAEHGAPQTAEQIETGRKAGAAIATELAEEIRGMGLPGAHATAGTKPQVNDLVLRGYLLSIDEGSAAKRVTVGFGSGSSELRVAAEGFQVTPQGLRKLGSGTLDSTGAKTPGGAVGVVAMVATGNPAGLIVSSGMKAYGEYSGSAKIEGRAKAVAKEIAERIKPRFQQQGWIN